MKIKRYAEFQDEVESRLSRLKESASLANNMQYFYEVGEIFHYGAMYGYGSGFVDNLVESYASLTEPNQAKASEFYKSAADLGHRDAQYRYAKLQEKSKNKDRLETATHYYLKAALQGQVEAKIKLKKINPSLFAALATLKNSLHNSGCFVEDSDKFALIHASGEILIGNIQQRIDDTISAFIALMNVYQYLTEKKSSDFEQPQKRSDFAAILKTIRDAEGDQVPGNLSDHSNRTKNSFLARTHLRFFTGSQHYRDKRQACFGELAKVEARFLKSALIPLLEVIDKDNRTGNSAAQDIAREMDKAPGLIYQAA